MPHTSRRKLHISFLHLSVRFSESNSVYISNSIRTFGLDLVGIFVPIYLFSLSFPPVSNNPFVSSAFWPAMYFFIRSITALLFLLTFASFLFSKFSLKALLVAGNVLTVITILSLSMISSNPLLFVIPAVLSGMVSLLYWVPYRLFFAEKDCNDDGEYGKNIGISEFLQGLVHATSPLLGGLLITYVGFSVTFFIAALLILVSILPIVETVHENTQTLKRHHNISHYFFDKKYTKSGLAFMGIAMDDIIFAVFWSLLLLYMLENFVKIGALNFVSVFLGAVSILVAVKFVDSPRKKAIHRIGVGFTAFMNLVRPFLRNPIGAYIVEILDRLNPFYVVPFDARTYEIAEKTDDDLGFLLFRNFCVHLGVIISLLLSFIVLFYFNWVWVFVIAAFGSLLTYLITQTRYSDFK